MLNLDLFSQNEVQENAPSISIPPLHPPLCHHGVTSAKIIWAHDSGRESLNGALIIICLLFCHPWLILSVWQSSLLHFLLESTPFILTPPPTRVLSELRWLDSVISIMCFVNFCLQINRLVAYDDDDYVPSAAKFSVSNPLPERIPWMPLTQCVRFRSREFGRFSHCVWFSHFLLDAATSPWWVTTTTSAGSRPSWIAAASAQCPSSLSGSWHDLVRTTSVGSSELRIPFH